METHSLRILEFEKIQETLEELCMSEEGRNLIKNQEFFYQEASLKNHLEILQAIRNIIQKRETDLSGDFPPIGESLHHVQKEGAVLEAGEIAAVGRFLQSASSFRDYFKETSGSEGLTEIVNRIIDHSETCKKIFFYLDREGNLKEDDIPELRAIQKSIKAINRDVNMISQSYMNRPEMRKIWTSDRPTQRDGRTVLPVQANFKSRLNGVIHRASASGTTVYIEPNELVQQNNKLVEEQNRYHQEVFKILKALSASIRSNFETINITINAVGELDAICSKAQYSLYHACFPAKIGRDELHLQEARHPLLGKNAVPINIEYHKSVKILIITGPNTGGKTVSLKTVGLLSLMNQFGMEIPASEGSILPIFDNIYCDVGDEQSIEQSISTFSGHMRTISYILKNSGPDSLVLLDELGAGTDPEEGSAIAMAILDAIIELQSRAIITTHHGVLKKYGYGKEGVENASVEFDKNSLSPTYRLLVGVPGASHAIDIASGMGLSAEIIEKAVKYREGRQSDTAKMIQELIDREQKLSRKEQEIDQLNNLLENERFRLKERENELEKREIDLSQAKLRDVDSFLSESRKRLEGLVRELREGELDREKRKKVKEFSSEVEKFEESERKKIKQREKAVSGEGKELREGMEVRILSTGKRARVRRKTKDGRWLVEVGSMKIPLERDKLEAISNSKTKKPEYKINPLSGGEQPSLELDLRGKRLDEALNEVSKQIDAAIVANLQQFGIIHGTGEGILQKGIREYLRDNPHVKDFSYARPEEGGFGKTNVRLA